MKKFLAVNLIVIAATTGCVSTQSIMRDGTKQMYGKEAFQEPKFSNPHYNDQYATYKKLAAQFKSTGKIPVNWSEFEKCDLTTEEAANIIEPKPSAEVMAAMAENARKAKAAPQGSLAKQAGSAQFSSNKNSTVRETTLVLAEIHALKGNCGSAEELSKSTAKQIRNIVKRTKSTTTVYVYGKKHVSGTTLLLGTTSLHDLKAMGVSYDVKEMQEMSARKKQFPWEGAPTLQVSLSKTEKSSIMDNSNFLVKAMASGVYDGSKTLNYTYSFNNGNRITFFNIGGSVNTSISESLPGKRSKSISYAGAKLATVTRMQGYKRHGLQENHAKGKSHECFVDGVKSYKTDCEVF
ncbi:MAG: hypothetical protein OQK25_01775 [Gammaproteobacteria bacterium]|nr:hypothetical protein [Gammaproteobacteria bacterium]